MEAKEQPVSDMVEMVAKALVWAARFGPAASNPDELWKTCERHEKVLMRAYARAAISAMREPVLAMVEPHVAQVLQSELFDAALLGSSAGPFSASRTADLTPAEVSDAANQERRPEPTLEREGR